MTETLFHKIRDGEIPSHTVFEDENVLAFLDINPATEGHTLIIPKEHYKGLLDCPSKVFSELVEVAQKLASHYEDILECDGFNLVQSTGEAAEQEIEYIHLHLIPRYQGGEFNLWQARPNDADLEDIVDDLRID
jgi:histidine triad (HIT) family protein